MRPISNKEILELLSQEVYGHEKAKKILISLVQRSRLRHYQKYIKLMNDDLLVKPMKALLLGESGTGKTFMLERLSKIFNFPLIKLDATHLNPTGASGGINPEKLKSLINKNAEEFYANDPQYFSEESVVDQTVVFIDELDKLGLSFDSGTNWNRHVQSSFLTIFDNKDEFAGVSFVFAGAFTQIKDKRKVDNKSSIGFLEVEKDEINSFLDIEVVKAGIIPELVGRLTAIVEMDVFKEKDLEYILCNIVFPKKQIDLASCGVFDLKLSKKEIKEIVKKASESGQGVRYMNRAVDNIFLELEFDSDIMGAINHV